MNDKHDIDLDEGKTCCCCLGLETGYNVLGALSFVGTFFAIISSILSIKTADPVSISVSMVFAAWVTIYSLLWLQGYRAKKTNNIQLFK